MNTRCGWGGVARTSRDPVWGNKSTVISLANRRGRVGCWTLERQCGLVPIHATTPVDDDGIYGQIWSLGHRNVLGLAIDLEGQLWDIEMGPSGGDELNLITRAANYGYPLVSAGDHYDGREIPDHDTHPEFEKPAISWNPVISPGDLMIYRGDLFSDWRGDAVAAGLSSQAIVRVELDGVDAREVGRYEMGARIRSIVEGPDGAIWVLEDDEDESAGRLLKLTPKN